MKDTAPDIEKRFREMMLSRSPGERLAMACRMFSTAKSLVLAGISQEPEEQQREGIRRRLFLRFYRDDFGPAERKKILEHLGPT